MMAAVDFEANRFQSAAAHYLAGRPPYPRALIERTADLIGLTRADRVLDLGCGPAQLALAFAPRVLGVVAMDPEPAMLQIARAAAASVPNVEVVEGRSENLGPALGVFKAVVIGRAFHWMDRARTLADLDRLITPDGAVVLIGDDHPEIPENARIRAFDAFFRAYTADDERHALRAGGEYAPDTSVLLASPFRRLERIIVYSRLPLDVETLAHRLLSLSSTSRARLGDRADAMLADLRQRFAAWEAEGPMEEVLASSALIAWRG